MISIYTPGRLLLKQHDSQITGFVSQKAVALFVYLVAHPRIHQRDALAGLFWSDTTDKQALKNLRTVLSSLQKQPGDYLDVTRQTLEIINRDALWFDVHDLDSRLDRVAERMAHPYSPRRQMQDLEAAVHL